MNCMRIQFNLDGLDIVMSADPNRKTSINTWRDVKTYCDKLNIKFSNQSFVSVLREERDRFFAIERLRFNKKQRREIYNKSNRKCNHCKKAIELSGMEIDHIKPLASGGDNSYDNLQVLCKPCHFVKTKEEKDNHEYFKISETHSSFNESVREIVNSDLAKSYAFVESIHLDKPSGFNSTVYTFDINRCRKNCVLNNQHKYPVYTCRIKKYER